MALQIQEVAPTDSRGGPQHVYSVALCSVWHFALRGMDSRGGPHHVYDVALCSVWHLVPFKIRRTLARLWDTSSSIPTPGGKPPDAGFDCAINRSTLHGTWIQWVQEY